MPSAKERCEPLRYQPFRLLSWQLPYHQPPFWEGGTKVRSDLGWRGNRAHLPCKVWHNFSPQSLRPCCRCRRQTWRRECRCDCTRSRRRSRKTNSGKGMQDSPLVKRLEHWKSRLADNITIIISGIYPSYAIKCPSYVVDWFTLRIQTNAQSTCT